MPLIGGLLGIDYIERKLRLPHATMGKKTGSLILPYDPAGEISLRVRPMTPRPSGLRWGSVARHLGLMRDHW